MPNSYSWPGQRLALLAGLALLTATAARAQTTGVTIGATGAPDASAVLDVRSSSQGLLPPRLTEAARLAMGTGTVPAPAVGLLVYQTDGAAPGYYYASSATTWVRLTDATTADGRYIQNQTAATQTGGFRVSGSGQVGTTLTAGGSVTVPVASAYTYSGAKSYSILYGSSDFQTESYNVNYPKRTLYSATADEVTGYNSSTTYLRVPVHLPQGAVLVSFTLYYYDDNASNLTVTFNAATMNALAGATGTTLASFLSNGNSGYASTTVPLSGTIDNTTRAYFIRAILPDYGNQTISGVRVNYTVSQAE